MLKNFKFNFTTDKVTFPCKKRQLLKRGETTAKENSVHTRVLDEDSCLEP